jgi:hypothetical protein
VIRSVLMLSLILFSLLLAPAAFHAQQSTPESWRSAKGCGLLPRSIRPSKPISDIGAIVRLRVTDMGLKSMKV